jgi:hypothetical protein
MISRGTIIAGLLVLELAIICEAVIAVQGGGQPFHHSVAQAATGGRLAEGGEHRVFDGGAHPALTVDIGYADLTIVARAGSQIDVALSRSHGLFQAREPIEAEKDGDTVRITATDEPGWTVGDSRMVTVLVPADTQVTVVKGGDIKASGLRAASSFNSVGDGTVTVEDYNAPSLHATSNGRISLVEVVAARLDATSGDGRVEGSGLQVRNGSIESDGRVTLGFASGTDTVINAETDDGKVSASGFAAGASSVTSKGDSDNSDDDASSQTVRVGAGDGRLDVHTSDGNIRLTQEG